MSALQHIPTATTVEEVIGLAVGGGSTCWENTVLMEAGVFQDGDANAIVTAAVQRINELTGHRA